MNDSKPVKRYTQDRNIYIVAEGGDDKRFIQLLKEYYCPIPNDPRVKIRDGRGGSIKEQIKFTKNISSDGYYKKILFFDQKDTNNNDLKEYKTYAKKNNVELIINKPSIEAILLRILSIRDIPKTEKQCKDKLAIELRKIKKNTKEDYRNIYKKNTITQKQKKIKNINKIIKLINIACSSPLK
jgi:hypothetical protein